MAGPHGWRPARSRSGEKNEAAEWAEVRSGGEAARVGPSHGPSCFDLGPDWLLWAEDPSLKREARQTLWEARPSA